ncbi:MAG TPA: TolC family protein [Burkholderiales bacterium]|nr:TolC family protein [Burkholderiales bacterium]
MPLAALALAGCATYRPVPLPQRAVLVREVTDLRHVVPGPRAGEPSRDIDVAKSLDIDEIGMLAILNDPELLSERGAMSAARAGLLQASLLPNPSVGLGYAALLGGPGTSPSYTASLSQDIASLVTYRARVQSARAQVSQVNAELLWREWQVAQKARLLALELYWGGRAIGLTERDLAAVSGTIARVRAATAAGDLGLSALAPLLAAEASAQQSLAALRLGQLRNWQALDALLGMVPSARLRIARPALRPLPADVAALIADLPSHRPDLIALRLGYRSSEQDVRAAILSQFPALVLGLSWTSDTSEVRSAGPNVTFDLPIFDHHQGRIAQARATRLLLHEQYQARLDRAVAGVDGLVAQSKRLSADLAMASRAAASAASLAETARTAYAQGNLELRALTDYERTALQRRVEVVALRRRLGEDRIALAVELGLGLPKTRIAPRDPARSP